MKMLRNLSFISMFLALPGLADAQTAKPAPAAGMNCPMMDGSMQKGLGGMMTDLSAMMKDTTDPALKARMQKMHEQMAAMMTNMRKMGGMMGGGMMGGGMMGGGMMDGKPAGAPSVTPPATPEDHAAHHPKQ